MAYYAVISFFNYRKEMTFHVHNVCSNFLRAQELAYSLAVEELGKENVIDALAGQVEMAFCLDIELQSAYTENDGYYTNIYGVMALPAIDNSAPQGLLPKAGVPAKIAAPGEDNDDDSD